MSNYTWQALMTPAFAPEEMCVLLALAKHMEMGCFTSRPEWIAAEAGLQIGLTKEVLRDLVADGRL